MMANVSKKQVEILDRISKWLFYNIKTNSMEVRDDAPDEIKNLVVFYKKNYF